jgi:hypothetical protein
VFTPLPYCGKTIKISKNQRVLIHDWAAEISVLGHMRPAGRGFATPALNHKNTNLGFSHFSGLRKKNEKKVIENHKKS